MAENKRELSREERIRKEERRLKGVFRGIDPNKRKVVDSLIQNAAFMTVALEDLQEEIIRDGYTVEYQNGENQRGTKQSDAVKTYNTMVKNHATVIRQLEELAPETKKGSRLDAFRKG